VPFAKVWRPKVCIYHALFHYPINNRRTFKPSPNPSLSFSLHIASIQTNPHPSLFHYHIQKLTSKLTPPTQTSDTTVLFPGFTSQLRERTKLHLLHSSSRNLAKLTPAELPLLEHFPPPLADLITSTLKAWSRHMRQHLRLASPSQAYRPIHTPAHIAIIMQHLEEYKHRYEALYNAMEVCEHSVAADAVAIHSTGYGVKVFLGLLMADRLMVIEMKRRAQRERIGFLVLGFGELSQREGEGRCNVCLEEMTTMSEGEVPLRMVVCCGQILGAGCLRQWVNSLTRGSKEPTCPLCRYKLSEAFVDKLFVGYEGERVTMPEFVEEEDEDEEDGEVDMDVDVDDEDLEEDGNENEELFRPAGYSEWRVSAMTQTVSEVQWLLDGNHRGSLVQHRDGDREDDFRMEG
jgi:hypothetical protein